MQGALRVQRHGYRRKSVSTAQTENSPSEALQRCVGIGRQSSTADVLTLQRALGNAAVARMLKLDPRAIFDDLHLQSEFWGRPELRAPAWTPHFTTIDRSPRPT